jgi:hypothetical protein
MPIVKAAPVISAYKITQADKDKKVYYTLRVARADTKLIGKRAVRFLLTRHTIFPGLFGLVGRFVPRRLRRRRSRMPRSRPNRCVSVGLPRASSFRISGACAMPAVSAELAGVLNGWGLGICFKMRGDEVASFAWLFSVLFSFCLRHVIFLAGVLNLCPVAYIIMKY